jgi:putative SOS response-associated peptidase YedK
MAGSATVRRSFAQRTASSWIGGLRSSRGTSRLFRCGDDGFGERNRVGDHLGRRLFRHGARQLSARGVRGPKSAAIDGQHELFGFLTTEANGVVAPIHPKAMPVILTTPVEVDLWLLADAPKALELQRPLPDHALRIVASGEKEDGPREDAMPDRDQDPMLAL